MGQKDSKEPQNKCCCETSFIKPKPLQRTQYVGLTSASRNMGQTEKKKAEEVKHNSALLQIREEQLQRTQNVGLTSASRNMGQTEPKKAEEVKHKIILEEQLQRTQNVGLTSASRNMGQTEPKKAEEEKSQTFTNWNGKNMRKIYVANIPKDTILKDLQDYFSKFGEVVEAIIMNNYKTGKPYNYGFIRFASEECAQKVLALQNHILLGKVISVKPYIRNKKEIKRIENESNRITGSWENLVEKSSKESEPLNKPEGTVKKKKYRQRKRAKQSNAKHDIKENEKNETEKEEQNEGICGNNAASISSDRRALTAKSIQLILNVSEEITKKLKLQNQFQNHRNLEKKCEEFVNEFSSGNINSQVNSNFTGKENLIDFSEEDMIATLDYLKVSSSFPIENERNSDESDDEFKCDLCDFSCSLSSYGDIFEHSNSVLHKNNLKTRFRHLT